MHASGDMSQKLTAGAWVSSAVVNTMDMSGGHEWT